MNEMDSLLKNILKDDVIPSEQDIEMNFCKLKMNLDNNKNTKYYFKRISYVSFKKAAIVSMCCLICITTILLGSSSTVRAAALTAIDSIKSIFVVEGKGNDIKIVQKPVNEVKELVTVRVPLSLSDMETEKLIGHKVIFPDKLAEDFELTERLLVAGVRKPVPYESISQIRSQLILATMHQEDFDKLSDYSPYRSVGAIYKYTRPDSNFGKELCISFYGFSSGWINSPDSEEVKIGTTKGFWVKIKYPEYSWSFETLRVDMENPPVINDDLYMLGWGENDVYYSLSSIKDLNLLTKEESIEIATEFQAAQP